MDWWWRVRFAGRRPAYAEVREFILARLPSGGICAELGVFKGDFSETILRVNRPRRLYLIDPWYPGAPDLPRLDADATYASVCERFASEIATETVVVRREPSSAAAAGFADETFDWIYIDGDHHFEAVRQDLDLYAPKVKRGGYIVCDDYHFAGNFDDGVTKAVDEFVGRGICRKVFKRRSQFVMRKPKR